MVAPDQVISPSYDRKIRIDGEGIYLFPTLWFLWNLALNNLLITKSLQSLRDGRPTEQRLADLIDDFSIMGYHRCVAAYKYPLLSVNFKQRCWTGYAIPFNQGQFEVILERVVRNKVVATEVPCQAPYTYNTERRIVCPGGQVNELRYQKYNNTLFRDKYPVKLKSLNPICGDIIQVVEPRSSVGGKKQLDPGIAQAMRLYENVRNK